MKKLFVLVFAIALCLAVLCFGASADYDENGFGVGNDEGKYQPAEQDENGVYQIGSAGQLYWFAQYVNQLYTNWSACAELTADITINEGVLDAVADDNTAKLIPWTPINIYMGTFDGNGHTIYGLYLHGSELSPGGNTGMFGSVLGTVKNLALADSHIGVEFRASSAENPSCIGGICGTVGAKATVSGCSFNGTVSAVSTSKTNTMYVGSVCGWNEGNLQDLRFSGSLTVKNTDSNLSGQTDVTSYGGGICGYNIGTVKSCINRGTITGGGYNPTAGGICGFGGRDKDPGTIQNCENYGQVTAITEGENQNTCSAGGILGDGSSNINFCKNEGYIHGANFAGGIAGRIRNGSIISSCTNSAKVMANYEAAGGICGYVYGSTSSVRECINSGDVELEDNSAGGSTFLGGICGIITADIVNCYNSGNLRGSQQDSEDIMNIGGIFGKNCEFIFPNPIIMLNCCSTGSITSPEKGVVREGGVYGSTDEKNAIVEHCFWLDRDGTGGTASDVTAMTEEQFARGEAAYELNRWTYGKGTYNGKAWKVGDDGYPVLAGGTNEIVKVTFVDSNNNILMTCCTNEGDTLKGIGSIYFGYATLKIGDDEITGSDLLSKTFNSDTKISVDGRLGYKLTATVKGSASKVYDGTTTVTDTSGLTLVLDGIMTGDVVSVDAVEYIFDSAAAGNRSIKVEGVTLSGKDAGKYVLAAADVLCGDVTAKITPKTLTPSINGTVSKVYDGTTAAPEGLSIALDGVITGGDVTATAASYVYGDASAGGNKTITASGITLIGEDAGNYTLSSTTVSSNVGEITPKMVTITADDKSAYMGDAMPGLSYKADGFLDHDGLTAEPDLSCNADMTKAGTYEITVSGGAASDNYKLVYKNGTLTVRQSWIITVKPGNGAADEISYIIPGESFTIPDAPKNGGYIFLGWRCGDETYKAGETIKVTSDMSFTAVWGNLPDVDPEEPEPEPELPFYDVAKGDWFYDAVKYVYYADLMDGVEEHIFAPNDTLTRAMVWTIIARAEGVDTDGGATWYAKAQEWVTAMGISDGENPSAAITRQELVTMLWRLAGEPALGSGISAPDAGSVSSWAQQAMSWAMYIGLIEGDENGAVTPAATATRAQAAAIFMRYLKK